MARTLSQEPFVHHTMKRTSSRELIREPKKLKHCFRGLPSELYGQIICALDEDSVSSAFLVVRRLTDTNPLQVNKTWNNVVEASWKDIMYQLGWEVYWPGSMRSDWRSKFIQIMNIKRRVKFLKDLHEEILCRTDFWRDPCGMSHYDFHSLHFVTCHSIFPP